MEVMILREDVPEHYSSVEAFDISVMENNPEDYIFMMTLDEYYTLAQIYTLMRREAGEAVKEKGEITILPEWERHGLLCGLAASFSIFTSTSVSKSGIESGYIMGALTPFALEEDICAVFFARRNEQGRRRGEVTKIISEWLQSIRH